MSVFVVHVTCVQVVATLDDDMAFQYQYRLSLPADERAYFEYRKRWREGEFPRVVGMVPIIEGTVEANGRLVPLIGIDPLADIASVSSAIGQGVSDVTFLTADSVIAQGTALNVGDVVAGSQVIASTDSTRELLIADIATAQHMLDRLNELDAVWLRTSDGLNLDWLEEYWPGLLAGFHVGVDSLVIDGSDIQLLSDWNPLHHFARSIAFNLGTLGALAIFVAGFIVFEAIWSEVKRRELEIQRLFALGVARSRIRTLFLCEAFTIGLLGSIAGILLGFAFIEFIIAKQVTVDPKSIDGIAVGKAVFVGVAVAVSVSILATRSHVGSIGRGAWLAILICAMLVSLYGIQEISGLGGAFLVIFGLCAMHLAAVVPSTVALLWKVCSRMSATRLMTRLNLRSAILSLKLLRTPLSAMSVAVAAALGLGLMIDSFEVDFTRLLDRRVQAGLHLASAANVDLDELRRLEGVIEIRAYYRARGALNSQPVEIIAADLDEWETARYGYSQENLDAVFVDEQIARRSGLNEGDLATIDVIGGSTISLPIVHVYSSYGDATGTVVVNKDKVDRNEFIRDRITVRTSGKEEEILRAIRSKYADITVASHSQIRQLAEEIFDRTFILANVMATVALLVAIVGLTATMFATISSRIAEIRLMRTLGVSRLRLNWLNFVQMTTFGIVVALVSLPFGFGIAWVLCELVNPRAFNWTIELHVLPRPILLPCLIALIGVAIASISTAYMQSCKYVTASQANVVEHYPASQ